MLFSFDDNLGKLRSRDLNEVEVVIENDKYVKKKKQQQQQQQQQKKTACCRRYLY